MSSQSASFGLLHPRIQQWVWRQGWTELRDAQEHSIRAIIPGAQDVLIAAATAAGKTEAAFLPALTRLMDRPTGDGLIMYISPIKALINDQFSRLDLLCDELDIPVHPWHGDISQAIKRDFISSPKGILLITPESLEAMFCLRGRKIPQLFQGLDCVIVDEVHAFIGTERGKQLQSLLSRVELALDRSLPRIGLSATLGKMQLAAEYLRPNGAESVQIIESKSDARELKVLIKGFEQLRSREGTPPPPNALKFVIDSMYSSFYGTNNLVFPNSKSLVEEIAYGLRKRCEEKGVENQFWPHHGSLARAYREDTEFALKQSGRPATAICTNTLELGIDIGAVKSVGQVGPPPTVAALRQRLGRSGRRKGEPAILRGFEIEAELELKSHLVDKLRQDLFEFVAVVSLLVEGWFEPPAINGLHLSTLVQQILSSIAQRVGATASHLFRSLCVEGAFRNVTSSDFAALLRAMAEKELITQEPGSSMLLLGEQGEREVNHYEFYAAFTTVDEYRVRSASEGDIGSLPATTLIEVGELIVLAGRTWVVLDIDSARKLISVRPHHAGMAPVFNERQRATHEMVRRRMLALYRGEIEVPILDSVAQRFLREGRENFQAYGIDQKVFLSTGRSTLILTWESDHANEALACVFRAAGYYATNLGICIEVTPTQPNVAQVSGVLAEFAAAEAIDARAILSKVQDLTRQKWDHVLPRDLLLKTFVSSAVDFEAARAWARRLSHRED